MGHWLSGGESDPQGESSRFCPVWWTYVDCTAHTRSETARANLHFTLRSDEASCDVDILGGEGNSAGIGIEPARACVDNGYRYGCTYAALKGVRIDVCPADDEIHVRWRFWRTRQEVRNVVCDGNFGTDDVVKADSGQDMPAFGDAACFTKNGSFQVAGGNTHTVSHRNGQGIDGAGNLERFGNRGYRAVQLEAGILGGKLYLAAYAQRLGATGLTFYDDDVVEFFSPHAQGKSAIFLMALGHGQKRRLFS